MPGFKCIPQTVAPPPCHVPFPGTTENPCRTTRKPQGTCPPGYKRGKREICESKLIF